jgi:nucleotide-binding universal stress UspA family protein
VLEHAGCPVMVVHTWPVGGPARVVVGLDASTAARLALRWAHRYARREDLPLVAVHAGAPVYSHYYPMTSMLAEGWEGPRVAAERLDGWLVQELGEDAATVERIAGNGPAARMLLDAAGPSDLLVVGRRGTGGVDDLLLGSVSRRVAAQAAGSVVVVDQPAAH